jgi:FkbM family methyltransferase
MLRSGLLSTPLGQRLFVGAYMLYKQKIEARNTKTVLEFIAPGSTVIDVGANIGYFTLQLARQVGATGEVIAIEPEPNNFARLSQVVARAKLEAKISLHQVAAADVMGQLYLKLDPYNPANHQLSDSGVSVEATTIDYLVGALGNPTITLIKIDVQGAEKKVLQGAVATIMRSHPTIFCEVDESGLRHFQSSALDLTNYLCDLGYTAYGLGPKHGYYPIDVSKMMQGLPTAWYTDFLFLRNVTS